METLGLERPRASELLGQAGGHVKTALVMERRAVGRDEARALLDEAGGEAGGVIAEVVGDLGEGRK
jgi:N-acetylmuramic acid 6-phosphate (MurNAc-6-P) etherase